MKYQYIIIAMMGLLLTTLIELTGITHFLEMKTLDARYELRSEYFRQQETSNQIVIIGIDDDSIIEIKQPFILWDVFFAEIFEKLGKYQAKVIGLDLIWTKRIDDFVKRPAKERNALRRSLLIAKNKYHTKIVMGIGATTRKSPGSQIPQLDTSLPMKQFGSIVGRDGFGVVNTLPDLDNYIRKIKLQYQSTTDDKKSLPGFDNIIASHFLNIMPVNQDNKPLFINYQLNKEFRILSFNEVLNHARLDNKAYFEKNFKDKVVLVGVTNVSGDILPSPIAQETSGVVIHAHAIDMLINNNLLIIPPFAFVFILNFFIAFLVVYFSSKKGLKTAIFLSSLVFLFYSIANLLSFNKNILLPYVAPCILIFWSFGVSFFYRFVTEERSKRRLAKFFRSYVNEQVVKEILISDKPIALEGKREKICILFADIRNFTTYSENLPPEYVVKVLNEYFSAMTEVILEHNGTVDKFIGDGLMAFFGAPLYVENPTLEAVKASLKMRLRLKELNLKWETEGHEQLDNGIGLHTGYALVGNIGSDMKMDYTAIGDSVNTASRVEGVTKTIGVPILLTGDAHKEVKDLVICDPKGDVPLKGRSNIFVYEVKSMREKQI
ncbi:MAG: adenylate/guanylate cyclase domain-containing protein [gamma proteobacterium symbiont of Taylorina sp.]|nr:adenylate/guanylate cyclase domain-containing protein [gamma proteobacterium symbiont of Taylorina sp.]